MENLGINPILLLTQVVNFLIMVFLLKKYLYKPVLFVLEEREKKVLQGLKDQEALEKEKEKLVLQKKGVIEEAKDEGKRIIVEMTAEGRKKEKEIIARAWQEAENILKKGKEEIKGEEDKLRRKLAQETANIALEMAYRAMKDLLKKLDKGQVKEIRREDIRQRLELLKQIGENV